MEKEKRIRAYLKAPSKQYKVFTKLQRKLNEQRHSCNYIQKEINNYVQLYQRMFMHTVCTHCKMHACIREKLPRHVYTNT